MMLKVTGHPFLNYIFFCIGNIILRRHFVTYFFVTSCLLQIDCSNLLEVGRCYVQFMQCCAMCLTIVTKFQCAQLSVSFSFSFSISDVRLNQ